MTVGSAPPTPAKGVNRRGTEMTSLNDRARFCNRSEPRASARAVSQYAARCTIAHGHLVFHCTQTFRLGGTVSRSEAVFSMVSADFVGRPCHLNT